MALAHDVDTAVDVTVDVVIQGQVFVGAVRVSPVDQVNVLAGIEQAANGRTVFLDIHHVRAIHQRVYNQCRNAVLHDTGRRLVAVKRELVLGVNFFTRSNPGGNLIGLEQVLHALAQVLIELNHFIDHLVGTELEITH